jgi:hypothetical protein
MRNRTISACVGSRAKRATRTASATVVAHRREAIDQAAQALLGELHHWKTPKEIHEGHPLIASVAAIRRDVCLRARNGLADLGAVRLVGQRMFVHEPRYLAWRFGERADVSGGPGQKN